MVIPDGYLFKPSFYQGFIKFSKVGTLLFNEILQFGNSSNLGISGGGINSALLALFTELKNLFGNLIVGFLAVGLLEKLLLKLQQLLIDGICRCCG